MAAQLFTNNAKTVLAGSIIAGATSLTVATGKGALFPNPSGGDWFMFTLKDASGNIEVCKCTARSGDTFTTIVRGQEGTTGQAFTAGDIVELRLTKGSLEGLSQLGADETVPGIKTFTAANVHQGNESHTGNETHSGNETFNGQTNLNGLVLLTKQIRAYKGADVASANDTVLLNDGNYFLLTGTGTVYGFTTLTKGTVLRFRCASTVTFAHNTAPSGGYTKLYLPGAANIVAQAGDILEFLLDTDTGYWYCSKYSRMSLAPDPFRTGMLFLESGTVAGAAQKDIALDAYPAFTHFKVIIRNAHGSSVANLYWRYSTDSGATFISTSGYNYIGHYINNTAAPAQTLFSGGSTAAAQIDLCGGSSGISNNATWGYSDIELCLFGALDTSKTAKIKWVGMLNSGGANGNIYVAGQGEVQNGNNDITDMRFLLSTGNIYFDYWLYAIPHSL